MGWVLFAIASLVFLLTLEPTVSFWDCGEYIATAYKLQVGHPPGAPTFQLIGRFFSLFAFNDVSLVAIMINALSAICSGFTIMFLFWTITHFARKLIPGELTRGKMMAVLASGTIGALAYTFSDSFWFSATEGEVYAMSSLFTAMTFWAIIKWEQVADTKNSFRWLILIAYLIGLSIGVHLLNLLAIPAITWVYYFKKSSHPNWKGIVLVLLLSFVILAAIMYGIIPEILALFASTELLFVNTFGLPFNSGTFFFGLLIVALIVLGLLHTERPDRPFSKLLMILSGVLILLFMAESSSFLNFIVRLIVVAAIVGTVYYWRERKSILNAIILGITFILIGYSSFFLLVIRSNANPPIDENNPEDAIALLAYLNREQYGSHPLFYGEYFNAPVVDRVDGTPLYKKDQKLGKYVVADAREKVIWVYDPDYQTVFPRMWNSRETRYVNEYKNWAGIPANTDDKRIPTFGENLRYFWRYQVNHMYFRYLFWNFVGRQNDNQGMYADVLNGNWKSGLGVIDNARLGPQDDIPKSLQSKVSNEFYFLPLLFGLIGLFYQFRKRYKDGLVVLALIFMTGMAIVVFLNQHAPQPRERDYAYAASFYAFAIWIGLSIVPLWELFSAKISSKMAAGISFLGVFILVPMIMAVEGWDDHDRSGRYTALQTAKNYLNSCAPNAILFTNGDNDTFPLWYAQEVENIRTDVRVVNLSLLQTDWYIDQMKRKAYDSDPIPGSLKQEQYANSNRNVTYLMEKENIKGYIEIKNLFDILHQDESRLQFHAEGRKIDFFPTKNFRISVDPGRVVEFGVVKPEEAYKIVNIEWKINRAVLTKSYLVMLDLLAHNNWERPVYYATTTGSEAYLGLQEYFQLEGLAYRLVPIRTPKKDRQVNRINTDAMYDNLMNKFEFDVADPGLFLNNDNVRMSSSIRNCYARCALALTEEGEFEKAIQICDKCLEMIPDESVPYNYFSISLAEAYYLSDAPEKGNAVMRRMIDIQDERLAYYLSFPDQKRGLVRMEIEQAIAILLACQEVVEIHRQTELSDRATEIANLYYQILSGTR